MGMFKNLFKRKEGGTVVGNLLRKAVNQASGGLLGNGTFKLEQGDLNKAGNVPSEQKEAEKQLAKEMLTGAVVGAAAGENKFNLMEWIKKHLVWVITIPLGAVITIYLILRAKKNKAPMKRGR